jgi:hypothetical protein
VWCHRSCKSFSRVVYLHEALLLMTYISKVVMTGAVLFCYALQMLVDWMAEEGIVQRILRTNLHQRQYVQEVSGCLWHSLQAAEQQPPLWQQ